jgi:hypothetical protein
MVIRYEDITTAIQVRHLQVPIDEAVHFQLDDNAQLAEAILRARGFDQAPVVDGNQVIGTVRRVSLSDLPTVRDAYQRLQPSELVSADAPVSNLLEWLPTTPCLYVLDGRRITGFVVEADLNKQPARVYFYLLIATLELALAQRLRVWMEADESRLIRAMGARMADSVEQRRAEARAGDSDTDLVAYMTFSEIVRVVGKTAVLREELGYPTRTKWKEVEALIELRNAVMHPTRDLVGRECSLETLAARDALLRRLLGRIDTDAPADLAGATGRDEFRRDRQTPPPCGQGR